MTVGHPGGRTLPTGLGIGATQEAWAVVSPTRAAGMPPIITVPDPLAIMPGPAGTQLGSEHGADVSVTRAAGLLPIITVDSPLMMASGRAGCGTGVGTGAAGWMGAWQWGAVCKIMSPMRAAGFPMKCLWLLRILEGSPVGSQGGCGTPIRPAPDQHQINLLTFMTF